MPDATRLGDTVTGDKPRVHLSRTSVTPLAGRLPVRDLAARPESSAAIRQTHTASRHGRRPEPPDNHKDRSSRRVRHS